MHRCAASSLLQTQQWQSGRREGEIALLQVHILSLCHVTLNGVFLSVYYIRDDIKENPYGAVHVVWLQQERGTNHWLYSFCQTDIGKWYIYITHTY